MPDKICTQNINKNRVKHAYVQGSGVSNCRGKRYKGRKDI